MPESAGTAAHDGLPTPAIPSLRRLRQEDLCTFQANPGYRSECRASLDLRVRLCLFPKEQNKAHGKEKPNLGDNGDPRCPQRLLTGEFVTL